MGTKNRLTQEGYDKLIKELESLKGELTEKNIDALKEARAQGDLSENAEYDAAREEQREINSRISEIELLLKDSEVSNDNSNDNFGKIVEIKFVDSGDIESYQLVGTAEADPLDNKISTASPLGMAILDAKKGDKRKVVLGEDDEYSVIVKSVK